MRRLAGLAAVALATLVGLYALFELRGVVALFLASVAIAAAAEPIVDALEQRRVPRPVALGVTFLAGIVTAVALVLLAAGPALDELQRAVDDAAHVIDVARRRAEHGSLLDRAVATSLAALTPDQLLRELAAGTWVANAVGVTRDVATALGEAAIVLVLSVYWAANHHLLERTWLSLVPAHARPFARETWEEVKTGAGDQLRRKLGHTVVAILALAVGFRALELDYPTLPALVAGFVRLVPLIGIPAGAAFAFAAALPNGAATGVAAAALTVAVLLVLRYLLGPRLYRARDYSHFLLVVVVVVLADALGLLGVVLAPPVTAVVQVLYERLFLEPPEGPEEALEARLAELKGKLGPEASPRAVSLVERLEALLVDAREVARRPS